jgi:hypothetical protein
MRVNSRVFTERSDMLDGIQIPNCPSQLRAIAERLMMMVTKPGYSVGSYNSVTQLDKMLILDYWREYDDLHDTDLADYDFKEWWLTKATEPDLVSRAARWLVSHNYLFLDPDVQKGRCSRSRNSVTQ